MPSSGTEAEFRVGLGTQQASIVIGKMPVQPLLVLELGRQLDIPADWEDQSDAGRSLLDEHGVVWDVALSQILFIKILIAAWCRAAAETWQLCGWNMLCLCRKRRTHVESNKGKMSKLRRRFQSCFGDITEKSLVLVEAYKSTKMCLLMALWFSNLFFKSS